MISALCRSKLIDEAKQLACEFEMKHDKYDVVILNSMLCAYCRSGEMENVMKMMKKMDESAINPDWSTFKILIKYFCKERLYLLAYRTMEDMHKKGHHTPEVIVGRAYQMQIHSFMIPEMISLANTRLFKFLMTLFWWLLVRIISWESSSNMCISSHVLPFTLVFLHHLVESSNPSDDCRHLINKILLILKQ